MTRWRPAHTLLVRVGPITALPEDDGLRAFVTHEVTDRAAVLAGELGLPLVPQIEVTLDELPGVAVGSDGQAVTAGNLDLERAWRLVAPPDARPVPFGWEWRPWASTVRHLPDGPAVVGAFVAEVVAGLLQRRPDRLLTVRQAVAYLVHQGGTDARDLDPDTMLRSAAPALAQGVGIADRSRVLDHLTNDHAPEQDRTEALIAELRAESIGVLVGPDLAAELDGPAVDERFRLVGEELFRERGVRVPELRMIADDRLAPRCVSVRVNSLTGRPHGGLPAGTVMVDAAPDELGGRFGRAEPVRHPASGARCATVSDRHATALRAAGHVTWNPLDHVVLTVAAEIGRRAASLVDVRTVEYELALLHRDAPDLVLEALEVVRLSELTALTRSLVRDGPGVRDLRRVLERLLAFSVLPDAGDRAVLDAAGVWAVLTGTPGEPAADEERAQFVRAGMSDLLAHRHATGSGRLAAVIVGHDVVDRMRMHRAHDRDRRTGRPLAKAEVGHLREAVRQARERTPETLPLVLLTAGDVRGALASLLAEAVPDVPVLAFEELPWDTEVACCGHLSLSGVEPAADEAAEPRRPV